MRLYTLPDGWTVDLDSVINVSPVKDRDHGKKVYTLGLLNGSVMSIDVADLPRAAFIDIARIYR